MGRWRRRATPALLALSVVITGGLFAACDGEDRPGVEVLSGSGTGSVSGTSTGSGTGSATMSVSGVMPSQGSDHYRPVSDVEAHARLALDVRDAQAAMAPAKEGKPVDWGKVTEIYERGGNSRKGDGSARTLAGVAQESAVLAQFPNGAALFGTNSFLDANVRAGLQGAGRGQGLSDDARRQLVEKGFLAVLYGKVLQELDAAREKIQQGNTEDAGGAPHNVDEAWAFYAGAQDESGARPYGLSATARKREADFGLDGKLDEPLQRALAEALEAARRGDLEAFDGAVKQVKGHLNAIFYLASLKYAGAAANDTEAGPREVHLAEGWAFFQTIRPAVAAASADAARAVEAVYSSPASTPLPSNAASTVYDALNRSDVLSGLGIPEDLVIRSPR